MFLTVPVPAYYMAPEVLENCYDKACDVWSVGVIAYILLCGYPPFNGESDEVIFAAIRKGRIRFPERAWASKSQEARSFVNSLLNLDPDRRLTAAEALSHPWIRANSAPLTRDPCADTKNKTRDYPAAILEALRQTAQKPGARIDDIKQEDDTTKMKALRQQINRLRISIHARAA